MCGFQFKVSWVVLWEFDSQKFSITPRILCMLCKKNTHCKSWSQNIFYYTLSCWIYQRKYIFAFCVISSYWANKGNWKPLSWKTRSHSCYTIDIVVADDLATQGTGVSAIMVLRHLSHNIAVTAFKGLTTCWVKMYHHLIPFSTHFILITVRVNNV